MALPPLARTEDLAAWLGQDETSLNAPRAEAILSAASTLVRTYTGRLWVDAAENWEDDVTDLQTDTVQQVTVRVAARVYENPRGATQQTTGPYSVTVAAWSALGMGLTDDEKSVLPVTAGTGIPGLSSVRIEAPRRAAGVPRGAWYCDDDQDDGS